MRLATVVSILWLAAAAQGSRHRPPADCGSPKHHSGDFVPDHILRLTYGNVSMGCQTRESVLVNGSSPGPEIRLQPGKTSWIRVYNDMADFNTTIVR